MGRADSKRRKRYRNLEKVRGNPELGSWVRTSSPYLVESRIEDYGRFARGVRSARGWRRVAGYALFVIFTLPLFAAVVSILMHAR